MERMKRHAFLQMHLGNPLKYGLVEQVTMGGEGGSTGGMAQVAKKSTGGKGKSKGDSVPQSQW